LVTPFRGVSLPGKLLRVVLPSIFKSLPSSRHGALLHRLFAVAATVAVARLPMPTTAKVRISRSCPRGGGKHLPKLRKAQLKKITVPIPDDDRSVWALVGGRQSADAPRRGFNSLRTLNKLQTIARAKRVKFSVQATAEPVTVLSTFHLTLT